MWTCLRVLIVADADEDVWLMLGALHSAGYVAEHRHVVTGIELDHALRTNDWDIVIAGSSNEGCPAPEVKQRLEQCETSVPLIMVSEQDDTHSVEDGGKVRSMVSVSRSELHRLGSLIVQVAPAVARATGSIHGDRQSIARGSGSGDLVSLTSAGIMVVDRDHIVRFANGSAARLFGLAAADLVGKETPIAIPRGDAQGEATELQNESGVSTTIDVQASRIAWNGEESVLLTVHDVTRRKHVEDDLRESFRDLAYTLSKAMASRDPYTTNHQRRVADLVVLVGARMGLSDGRLWDLRLGGLMHDIGKVAIPDEILAKPGGLAPEELQLAQTHAERGYEILRGAHLSPVVPRMALHHHEFLDGSGYPQKLDADSLSIEDRILITCNMVESISSFRLYRRALSRKDTIAKLLTGRGTKHDPVVVDCLIDILDRGQFALGTLSQQ